MQHQSSLPIFRTEDGYSHLPLYAKGRNWEVIHCPHGQWGGVFETPGKSASGKSWHLKANSLVLGFNPRTGVEIYFLRQFVGGEVEIEQALRAETPEEFQEALRGQVPLKYREFLTISPDGEMVVSGDIDPRHKALIARAKAMADMLCLARARRKAYFRKNAPPKGAFFRLKIPTVGS